MAFSHYVMFIHNEFIFQEESLPPFLSCRMRLNNRSELVLIIFYLHLINSGHADSSMAEKSTVSFLLEDKHVANEHHIIRKSHDATQKTTEPQNILLHLRKECDKC